MAVSGCSSSTSNPQAHKSSPSPYPAVATTACEFVTPADIHLVLGETMTKSSDSGPACAYVDAATTDIVTVSLSRNTPEGAKLALNGLTNQSGAEVQEISGLGDRAVLSIRKSATTTSALCAFADNGTVVVILVAGPHIVDAPTGDVALARKAAMRV